MECIAPTRDVSRSAIPVAGRTRSGCRDSDRPTAFADAIPRVARCGRTVVAGRCARGRDGVPVTRFVVHATATRYATEAAIACPSLAKKTISPQVIRHTTATHLLRAGVDTNTSRAWLGHVSIDTTNVYAEVDLETKAQMLAACGSFTPGNAPNRRWRDDPSLMQFLRRL